MIRTLTTAGVILALGAGTAVAAPPAPVWAWAYKTERQQARGIAQTVRALQANGMNDRILRQRVRTLRLRLDAVNATVQADNTRIDGLEASMQCFAVVIDKLEENDTLPPGQQEPILPC